MTLALPAKSKHLASVFAGIVLALWSIPARADVVTWGMETWECGVQLFRIQLGTGGPVKLLSMTGVVSATSLPSAKTAGIVRQTLFDVIRTEDVGVHPPNAAITETPSGARAEHAIDLHLLDINVKQRAEESVHIPVALNFSTPIDLPTGKLTGYFNTISYVQPQGTSTDPFECLDTEVHLTLQFVQAQ